MIPYFQILPFHIFGLTIHLFEILTSMGIFLGIRAALQFGKRRNLKINSLIDVIMIALATGFIGAHWMHVWFYEKNFSQPLELLKITKGISSTGGLIAGALGSWIFLKVRRFNILEYGDPLIKGVVVAMFWGRLGCTVAHDHIGRLTDFPLGIAYTGGIRHNLGMEEAIALGIFLLVTMIPRIRSWFELVFGRWTAVATLYYGVVRFGLDFLRATDLPDSDARYWGLTPAQYVCIFFMITGLCLIYKRRLMK